MENETLSFLTAVLPIVLTALGSGGIVAAYFNYRSKRVEVEPDASRAIGDLQVQLAKAAENMVEGLNITIEDQHARIEKQAQEMAMMRTTIRQQSDRIAVLEGENKELKAELAAQRGVRNRDKATIDDLRRTLRTIKKQIDTGKLDSGPHKTGD